ncbi:MAG: hypothetical protein GY821_12765 [Gammaproteobacteria bacterium]|nr:hypothetical protein [Gammaproteobacteria bacterium]
MKIEKKMVYTNPWYVSGLPKIYQRHNCITYKSKCGRGEIVKVSGVQFDYLINGKVVSQRCGKNMELLDMIIAAIYDGVKSDFLIERAKSCYLDQL